VIILERKWLDALVHGLCLLLDDVHWASLFLGLTARLYAIGLAHILSEIFFVIHARSVDHALIVDEIAQIQILVIHGIL
jgi:hypothetical protein